MSDTPLDRVRAIVADPEIPDGRFVRVDCEDFCEALADGPDETPALTKLWNAADGDLRSPNKHFIPSAGDLRAALREYDAHKSPGSSTVGNSTSGGTGSSGSATTGGNKTKP